jgi:hypothetical protein
MSSRQLVRVLGRDGYLRQYAIDHGLNPYQPVDEQPDHRRSLTDTSAGQAVWSGTSAPNASPIG